MTDVTDPRVSTLKTPRGRAALRLGEALDRDLALDLLHVGTVALRHGARGTEPLRDGIAASDLVSAWDAEIHDATHPGARPASRRTAADEHDPKAGARANLLDALDSEAQEEDDGPART